MSRYFYVYVGERADGNLRIGFDQQVWGWKNPWYGEFASQAADLLGAPGVDSYLVLAQVARPDAAPSGWPRTPAGDIEPWKRAKFQTLTIGRIDGPMYESGSTVWPDAVYPYRVDLESFVATSNVAGSDLDEGAVLAIRESALRRGNAILGPAPLKVAAEAAAEGQAGNLEPDRLLDGLDGLNGQALTLVRKEQSKLRKAKLNGAATAECTLCGRSLPVGLLRLAHIKRRAACSPAECLNQANLMLACTLGCDELFERGYVGGQAGQVVAFRLGGDWTEHLTAAIDEILGKRLGSYTATQETFFKWHRDDHQSSLG